MSHQPRSEYLRCNYCHLQYEGLEDRLCPKCGSRHVMISSTPIEEDDEEPETKEPRDR